MAFSRRAEKQIVKAIGIAVLIVCLLYFGFVAAVWAFFEIDLQLNLPKIQAALDQTCGVGIVQVDRDGYDEEFYSYYSLQADCWVDGQGGYTCTCATPVPASR
jgi:hypothetical protein